AFPLEDIALEGGDGDVGGADGGQEGAEPLFLSRVDQGGDDGADAEGLGGDLGDHDVDVVVVAYRRYRVAGLDAGVAEDVLVDQDAGRKIAGVIVGQEALGPFPLVDDRDVMPFGGELAGEGGADLAASRNQYVQCLSSFHFRPFGFF